LRAGRCLGGPGADRSATGQGDRVAILRWIQCRGNSGGTTDLAANRHAWLARELRDESPPD
jgi:hypothetical protein